MRSRSDGRWRFVPQAWPLLLLAIVCLLLTLAFVKFGSEVAERETFTFDHAIRDWVLAHRSPAAVEFFRVVTWLGSSIVLAPATVVVGWLVARKGAWRRPLLLAVAPAVFGLIVYYLKHRYQISRPAAGAAFDLGFSFPSGHASISMAAYVVLGYVLGHEHLAPRFVLPLGIVIAILVGVSRVYLDVHWASDVIGGWAIGGAYGIACCALYAWARRRAERRMARHQIQPA
jgi:undecaprenyl-diphosphatase